MHLINIGVRGYNVVNITLVHTEKYILVHLLFTSFHFATHCAGT